jgi:hypothetical protein
MRLGGIALKIGIAGAVGFGAIATGMIASKKGRNLLREAWAGRSRSTLEDRVLEVLWSDRDLSRRDIDVEEIAAGELVLTGSVRSAEERELCVALCEDTKGVVAVIDRLDVEPSTPRRHRR